MSSLKYIGLDVHLATVSIAVLNASGKLVMEVTIESQASALLDFLGGLRAPCRWPWRRAAMPSGSTAC